MEMKWKRKKVELGERERKIKSHMVINLLCFCLRWYYGMIFRLCLLKFYFWMTIMQMLLLIKMHHFMLQWCVKTNREIDALYDVSTIVFSGNNSSMKSSSYIFIMYPHFCHLLSLFFGRWQKKLCTLKVIPGGIITLTEDFLLLLFSFSFCFQFHQLKIYAH